MDGSSPPLPPGLPPWLDPLLFRVLAELAMADAASGTPNQVMSRRTLEAAISLRPALPLPQIKEAVAVAMWVAGAADDA